MVTTTPCTQPPPHSLRKVHIPSVKLDNLRKTKAFLAAVWCDTFSKALMNFHFLQETSQQAIVLPIFKKNPVYHKRVGFLLPIRPSCGPTSLSPDHCTIWSNGFLSLMERMLLLYLQCLRLSGAGNRRLFRNWGLISHWARGRSGSPPLLKSQPRHLFSLEASRGHRLKSRGSSTQLPRRETLWTHCRFLTRPRLLREPVVTFCRD